MLAGERTTTYTHNDRLLTSTSHGNTKPRSDVESQEEGYNKNEDKDKKKTGIIGILD